MEEMRKYINFIRLSPQINATTKSVLEQLKFISDELEKSEKEKKEKEIMTP